MSHPAKPAAPHPTAKTEATTARHATRLQAARARQRRRLGVRIAVIGAAAIAVLFTIARSTGNGGTGGRASGPPFAVGQPGPGAKAPTFTLPSTAGGTFDLAAQRGKTVLLYFHEGLGCEPCWTQTRDLEANWAAFRALGIDRLVAIAGNPLGALRVKSADEGLRTPVLADPQLTLGERYRTNRYTMMGTSAYGHSFILVGRDGTIRWRADYGGPPDYTMYVSQPALLADLRAGLATGAGA